MDNGDGDALLVDLPTLYKNPASKKRNKAKVVQELEQEQGS
jgi:hypothetical protein